ncbi:MAG: laccase domain-containing protein [Actinomycetota bacterium]
MARRESVAIGPGTVEIAFTDRTDGDLRVLPPDTSEPDAVASWRAEVAERRAKVVDLPWSWLRQVHGARAVLVTRPGEFAGAQADAAVTTRHGCAIAVSVADCAPVILVAEAGVAAVHAGWRGLVGGVVDAAASQLRAVAGDPVAALVGPCIQPAAYEFGADGLDEAVAALGEEVRGETAWGTPGLDVPAGVRVACERAGWPPPTMIDACTSDDAYFSHRIRSDLGRQVAVAWLEPGGDAVVGG